MSDKIKKLFTYGGTALVIIGFIIHLSMLSPLKQAVLLANILITLGIVCVAVPKANDLMAAKKAGASLRSPLIYLFLYICFIVIIWLPI